MGESNPWTLVLETFAAALSRSPSTVNHAFRSPGAPRRGFCYAAWPVARGRLARNSLSSDCGQRTARGPILIGSGELARAHQAVNRAAAKAGLRLDFLAAKQAVRCRS